MSSFAIFVVAVCLVQQSLGACLGSPICGRWPAPEIAVPVAEYFRPSYDVIDYGVTGYGAHSYGITGYDVTDYAVTGYGITDRIVEPSYGGTGVGNVAVAGELPVRGSAAVAGQVPIVGAVWFEGPVRAVGSVTISGSSTFRDCGLQTRHCGC